MILFWGFLPSFESDSDSHERGRDGTTCSKRPHVGFEPWAAAARTRPWYRRRPLYQGKYQGAPLIIIKHWKKPIMTPDSIQHGPVDEQAYHQCVKTRGWCWCRCCCLTRHWSLTQAGRTGLRWTRTSCWRGKGLKGRSGSLCRELDPYAPDSLSPFPLKKRRRSATRLTELNFRQSRCRKTRSKKTLQSVKRGQGQTNGMSTVQSGPL